MRAEQDPTKGLGSAEELIPFQGFDRSQNRDGRVHAVERQKVDPAAA